MEPTEHQGDGDEGALLGQALAMRALLERTSASMSVAVPAVLDSTELASSSEEEKKGPRPKSAAKAKPKAAGGRNMGLSLQAFSVAPTPSLTGRRWSR